MPSVTTTFFTTPQKDATFSADEHTDSIANNAGKLTPIVATPPEDATNSMDGPREANGHDAGNPTPSVATPQKTAYLAQMNLGMLSDTKLKNRCQASRRQVS
jgi:hypothetical protein